MCFRSESRCFLAKHTRFRFTSAGDEPAGKMNVTIHSYIYPLQLLLFEYLNFIFITKWCVLTWTLHYSLTMCLIIGICGFLQIFPCTPYLIRPFLCYFSCFSYFDSYGQVKSICIYIFSCYVIWILLHSHPQGYSFNKHLISPVCSFTSLL